MKIIYDKVVSPRLHRDYDPVELTEATMEEHRRKVFDRMKSEKIDALVIYADREHGANFSYLTGFEPRFEEALLILFDNGTSCLMLGNENLKMSKYSYIGDATIHVPYFSLPNQPMEGRGSFKQLLKNAGICNGMNVGCVGWKVFTNTDEDNGSLLEIPAFISEALRQINYDGKIFQAGYIFQGALDGIRIRVNANEIAHYEFGAGVASTKVLDVLNHVTLGITEMRLADRLSAYGQPTTVTTICAGGDRFKNATVFPRNRKICLGEPFSVTFGLRGGLTSRAGYVVETRKELSGLVSDYIEKVAMPYYKAAILWYENIGVGVSGSEIYRMIENTLPKEIYHWDLNPGHYTADEEWTASPFYRGSPVVLKSGMMLQMDIIPNVSGYAGVSAEDGIVIADEKLRQEICDTYPAVWKRMRNRRDYMEQCLGITLKEEVLPLSDICGYLRPLILNHGYALRKIE